ncbi:receptor-interacting serine/threonine-protein kinase 2 isoform X1 [Lepisosteus oculatus]|uniref:receptor-interacting serine/threonine-protein kinase 2 isoform X1 n=2 Tax=Lepisosteus oculatus TaxID=7918 RepID=UPI0035F52EA0
MRYNINGNNVFFQVRMAQHSFLPTIPEQDVVKVVLTPTSSGSCLKGSYSRTGRQVCIKVLSVHRPAEREWSEQFQEIEQVRRIRSDRVLAPLGVYKTHHFLGLVSEWMSGGSLHTLLNERQRYPELTVPLLLRILLDVAEGLSHLHGIPLSHQALKPNNILLDAQYRAKVCDYGLLQWKKWNLKSVRDDCNGHWIRDLVYLSPEVLRGETPAIEGDLYSFGMVMWETLNRRQAYEGIGQPRALPLSVQSGMGPGIGEEAVAAGVPQCRALSQLMALCWSRDPASRPRATDCLLVLRSAIEAFHPDSIAGAVLQLNESKERALLYGKDQSFQELQVEIHNLETSGCCGDSKNPGNKTVLLEKVQTLSSASQRTRPQNQSSPPSAQGSPPTACHRECWIPACTSLLKPPCQSAQASLPQGPSRRGETRCSPPPKMNPPPFRAPVLPRNLPLERPRHCSVDSLPGKSCCQILQDRRESIVRGLTEGGLNKILDMLRSRQLLTPEAYELVRAARTLADRTRSLLDTCVCLGERAAELLVVALGLVSASVSRSPAPLFQ